MSKIPEGLKCEVTPEDAYPNGVPAIPDGWEFVAFVRAPALYSMALLTNGEVEGISTATSMWGRPCIIVRRKQKCSWCKDTGVIEVPSIMVPGGMCITNKPCEHCQPKPKTKPFCPDCGSVQHGTSVCPKLMAEDNAKSNDASLAKPRIMRHPSDPITSEPHPEQEGCRSLGCKPVPKVKTRRFLIEDDPGGFAIRPGQQSLEALRDAKIIREVKPIGRRHVENLYYQANRQSRMEDGVEVMAGYLSRLGIEVGD